MIYYPKLSLVIVAWTFVNVITKYNFCKEIKEDFEKCRVIRKDICLNDATYFLGRQNFLLECFESAGITCTGDYVKGGLHECKHFTDDRCSIGFFIAVFMNNVLVFSICFILYGIKLLKDEIYSTFSKTVADNSTLKEEYEKKILELNKLFDGQIDDLKIEISLMKKIEPIIEDVQLRDDGWIEGMDEGDQDNDEQSYIDEKSNEDLNHSSCYVVEYTENDPDKNVEDNSDDGDHEDKMDNHDQENTADVTFDQQTDGDDDKIDDEYNHQKNNENDYEWIDLSDV